MAPKTPPFLEPERAAEIVEAHSGPARAPCCRSCTTCRRRSVACRPQATPFLAQALNLSRAEVHGTISFYHDFRSVPGRAADVRLCRAEACQSMGGRGGGATCWRGWAWTGAGPTADGAVTVEPVYCLGLCAVAPAALVDGDRSGGWTRRARGRGGGPVTRVFVPKDAAGLGRGR
jgi:hypothetical protein